MQESGPGVLHDLDSMENLVKPVYLELTGQQRREEQITHIENTAILQGVAPSICIVLSSTCVQGNYLRPEFFKK